jgi:hypothetical protein
VYCLNTTCVSGVAICVLSQCFLCLWFVHSVSCPNTVCVFGLSILCLVSILPLSLACPFCVLSQNCLCLWLVHLVACLNTACVSGLSNLHLVSILPVSLVCPFSITPSVFSNVCYRIKHCFLGNYLCINSGSSLRN